MRMDIRLSIGIFFSSIGAVLAFFGLFGPTQIYTRSLGINVNLEWGVALLGFGIIMVALATRTGNTRTEKCRREQKFRAGTTLSHVAAARSVAESFYERYYRTPRIFRAPGRLNLIGEHTDYSEGFVMPAALDRSVWIAAAERREPMLRVYSCQFDEEVQFLASELHSGPRQHWSDYVRGVAAELSGRGLSLAGADLLIASDVPIGAGLSSSAALEVAAAVALLGISGIELPAAEIAELCQQAEHKYAGTRCGIMDQFIALCAEAGHALLLDCRSLTYRPLPVDAGIRILICNSMVNHAHATGEYNLRRSECEAGFAMLRKLNPRLSALRDASLADLERACEGMPPAVFRRCRHVISENARVLAAANALERCDLRTFGALLYESHASLRDDFQVSCRALDLLVELASQSQYVYGARMTGGGFGGCTINLVRAEAVEQVRQELAAAYQRATGIAPETYVCFPGDGAGEVVTFR